MRPPRNIVICCDGTGNSFDDVVEESNVVKLYTALKINEHQVGYYHPGVGTMGAPTSRGPVGRWISRVQGLAFGLGLLDNVADAYRYLMDNYQDGDRIYLFGFSRGAFTVRVLASLIHVYGLLCPGNHQAIPYILQMYSRNSKRAGHMKTTFEPDDAFKWQFSHTHEVTIHFCGIWDTVSTYGWFYDPIELPFLGNNPIIKIGRHAVSIDERRCFYQDNLWGESNADQDIRQVWFSGVHSDVGGSYLEPTSGLSKIPLEWMLKQASNAGLCIDKDKAEIVLGREIPVPRVRNLPRFAPPDANAVLHESLTWKWWPAEFLPQKDPHKNGRGWIIPLGRTRTIPPGSLIHESVFESMRRPRNLPIHSTEPWEPF
jgi:uncharacterized protein (DUF2235 family)